MLSTPGDMLMIFLLALDCLQGCRFTGVEGLNSVFTDCSNLNELHLLTCQLVEVTAMEAQGPLPEKAKNRLISSKGEVTP